MVLHKRFLQLALCCTLFALNAAAKSDDEGIGLAGIPFVNYTSDDGVGFGAVGKIYWKSKTIKPYRYSIDAQIFITTNWVHSHYVRFDALDVFDLPLRIRANAGFYAVVSENYCGKGSQANCNPQLATNSQYYQYRYMEPYGILEARWKLRELPHKIELMASWRGSYYIPGTFQQLGPYPDSLYAKDFAYELSQNGGRGLSSVFQAGAMFDSRDNEPSPTEGYWIEGSVRNASEIWGSTWKYVGFNFTARGYLPFDHGHRVVLAGQTMFDGMIGANVPLEEIVRVGGSFATERYIAFGGSLIGRGLREEYYPGRVKIIEQLELRYRFIDFKIKSEQFDITAATFADAGIISWDFSQFDKDTLQTEVGFGGGLRVAWNHNFIVRFDVGVSPEEQYSPRFYLKVGNVF